MAAYGDGRAEAQERAWIPIKDIGRAGLNADQILQLTAMAMEELAVCQALVMIHGEKRGAEVYMRAGGHVRFVDGEPCVPRSAAASHG